MIDKEAYLIAALGSKRIGDDGAVIGEQVFSADAFCEGSHFLRSWMDPYQIGRKAMLVNLSDAVAMNAKALYALVTLSIPKDFGLEQIDALVHGLEDTAREWGCEIIGGDTIGGEKLHIAITLISQSSHPLYRTGIKEGDLLAFTGVLGQSKRDLERLMRGEVIAKDSKFYEPILRSEFVARTRAYLRAGMDISDGLFCDTNKLLELNGSGIEILKNITPEEGLSGEEYEMLIAFDPAHQEVIDTIAQELGVCLTVFASVCDNGFRYPCKSHHFETDS